MGVSEGGKKKGAIVPKKDSSLNNWGGKFSRIPGAVLRKWRWSTEQEKGGKIFKNPQSRSQRVTCRQPLKKKTFDENPPMSTETLPSRGKKGGELRRKKTNARPNPYVKDENEPGEGQGSREGKKGGSEKGRREPPYLWMYSKVGGRFSVFLGEERKINYLEKKRGERTV